MKNLVLFLSLIVLSFESVTFASNTQAPLTPEEKRFHMNRIIAAYETYEWNYVVAWSEAYLQLCDTIGPIATLYAEGLAATGQVEKAIKVLDEQIALDPKNYYYTQTKGNIYMFAGDYDSALNAFQQVVAVNPNYARPFVYMGDVYASREDVPNAVDNYLRAVDLFYRHDAYDECLDYTEKVLALQPQSLWGILFRAATFYVTDQKSEYKVLLKEINQMNDPEVKEILKQMVEAKGKKL